VTFCHVVNMLDEALGPSVAWRLFSNV